MTEKSIGPSYQEVAQKYKGDDSALEMLAKKVISGGSGVWGETAMAGHPQLSADEAAEMVKYILSTTNEKAKEKTLPTKGSFVASVPAGDAGKGVYILRAAYQDKGAANLPSLFAEQTFVLRSAKVDVHGFDEFADVNKMAFGGSNLIIPALSGAYISLKQIDVTGLAALELGASAPKTQLNAVGGFVELHIGSPTGPLLGKSKFLEASDEAGFAPGQLHIPITLPSGFDGKKQDLYIVFKNEDIPQGAMMVVMSAEFKMINERPIVEASNSSATVSGENYYVGKWNLTVKGTPNGDTKLIMDLEREGGKLVGNLTDPTGANPAIPISNIEESVG
ncbi:hypothetical protein SYJ56_02380 [Algoriphagus sp. D3-2-R+10]|uniref:hypothetical protein n=1 Tax=Algoriphagus aurantiacus TaxID=3103948 RepID=UPI002B381F27|nr:hypothetical protein [Algoriphagus sp. D3-2-R+10]MEB2774132.1 hypothetical protein [Algoriphagus sp. D3-2-R+10]